MTNLAWKKPIPDSGSVEARSEDLHLSYSLPLALEINQPPEPDSERFMALHSAPGFSLSDSQSNRQAKILERIAVRCDDKLVLVHLREVLWVQSNGNLLRLHLEHSGYDCRITMKDFSTLLNPDCFLRVHRNAIVNLEYVVDFDLPRYGNAFVHLRNGTALPISRTGRAVLRRNLLSLSRPSTEFLKAGVDIGI